MQDKLIFITTGLIGSIVTTLYGGWNSSLTTLLIFMAIDYIAGLIVAGVFKNSPKTKTGALESGTCFEGLMRKGMMLIIVLVGHRLDLAINCDYIRDAVCIAFMANEAISIIENAGLMGVPIPEAITNAIEILKGKEETENE